MTIELKHDPLSFGDDRHVYDTWVVHRPAGCNTYNVFHYGSHVAYMPNLIEAKNYIEKMEADSEGQTVEEYLSFRRGNG